MSSVYGERLKISIFGQSHSEMIGVVIDGLPAGVTIDMDALNAFMERRAPGRSDLSTSRKEADKPEFVSGLVDGVTCGAPLCAVIRNTNARPSDYSETADIPRPGHADYTAHVKYEGFEDKTGGGHFSGRLTAPLCVAGGIAKQILADLGISVDARIVEIAGNAENPLSEIEKAKADLDSVGGIIECVISGVPAGIGEPMFDGMENRIAKAVFGIPAVKGIEFGAGFTAARMRGSENNDPFYFDENGAVKTKTNNAGGILGGITNGMDIVFRAAVKPTPSIPREQESISYSTGQPAVLQVRGRHDPCIVPRAVPCMEAAAAIAVLDAML